MLFLLKFFFFCQFSLDILNFFQLLLDIGWLYFIIFFLAFSRPFLSCFNLVLFSLFFFFVLVLFCFFSFQDKQSIMANIKGDC